MLHILSTTHSCRNLGHDVYQLDILQLFHTEVSCSSVTAYRNVVVPSEGVGEAVRADRVHGLDDDGGARRGVPLALAGLTAVTCAELDDRAGCVRF